MLPALLKKFWRAHRSSESGQIISGSFEHLWEKHYHKFFSNFDKCDFQAQHCAHSGSESLLLIQLLKYVMLVWAYSFFLHNQLCSCAMQIKFQKNKLQIREIVCAIWKSGFISIRIKSRNVCDGMWFGELQCI